MIELQGIERVPPDRRHDLNLWGNLTLWLSANLAIPTLALGALAIPLFKLGFTDSLLVIVLFNAAAALPVALFATLGPLLGLRQMTISRFSFGWRGAQLMALFNVAACLGWSAVNVIVGAQLLAALTGWSVPLAIVGLAVLTTPVCIYGYRLVHAYERVAWIPMACIFASLAWKIAPQVVATATWHPAAMLSFGGAVFGFAVGWSAYAADYNVNQPEGAKVFGLTYLGVFVPCVLMETLGLALTTIPQYQGLAGGDLLAHALPHPWLLGGLALSVVATNIPNDYSLGLSMQMLRTDVPRHWWTLLGALLYVLVAIPVSAHFAEALTDFLLIIGYWLGPWAAILLVEHGLRRGVYNAEEWNTPSALPHPGPALLAMVMGFVGVALGASQALYTGPVARLLGNADVGFELAILLAAVTYYSSARTRSKA